MKSSRQRPVIGADGAVSALLTEWRPVEGAEITTHPVLEAIHLTSGHPMDVAAVVLDFDADLILVGVSPWEPFLGYAPDEIVGTAFSPTGLPTETLLDIVGTLIVAGTRSLDGMVHLRTSSGAICEIRAEQELFVDDQQQFTEMRSVLHLPD